MINWLTEPCSLNGTKHLWLDPDAEPLASDVTAVLKPEGGGAFSSLAYHWEKDGKSHEGLLLFHRNAPVGGPALSWVDSFHQSGALMVCTCERTTDSSVTGRGAYAAPPGPDWGWRITAEWPADGALTIHMTNIWPSGQEDHAVRIVLSRA